MKSKHDRVQYHPLMQGKWDRSDCWTQLTVTVEQLSVKFFIDVLLVDGIPATLVLSLHM